MVSRVHYTFLRTFHTILVISFHLSYITWYNFSSAIGEWIIWAWLLLLFLYAALFNSSDDKFAPKIRARHCVWSILCLYRTSREAFCGFNFRH